MGSLAHSEHYNFAIDGVTIEHLPKILGNQVFGIKVNNRTIQVKQSLQNAKKNL